MKAKKKKQTGQSTTRGNASQFFVAGELCRRGYAAVVTMGNTPNTDVLVSDVKGKKFVHVQVKTFAPGNRTCSVGRKAEKTYGQNFFWVLCGLPHKESDAPLHYYVIPAAVMAKNVVEAHDIWMKALGKKGQKHNDSNVRTAPIPPYKSANAWSIEKFLNRWDLIEAKLC
jgi:hypothetical protein